MGEHDVARPNDDRDLRSFMRRLLDDVQALERMLDEGMVESGVRRIGAEQEMFLVEPSGGPAPVVMELLPDLDPAMFTTELARFNLEANLPPLTFSGACLADMEGTLREVVERAREAALAHGADVLLTGILPTLRPQDLTLDNITPIARYHALNETISKLKSGRFQTHIKGLDELQFTHDNILLEACNTSFQVHFQTGPEEFASLYNLAQAVTAPVLAAAVNSPVLLKRRLWRETRIALFQQSIDMRTDARAARGARARVHFGDRWVGESILEIIREDIARFRVVLAKGADEDPLGMVARGVAPPLSALRLHNGTIYRWNRPCYGVADGVAHLRIENRVLPAGPTVADEVANAAFYFGLMSSVQSEYGPVAEVMDFDDAKDNFQLAARHGLMAQFMWLDGRHYKAEDLILGRLLPLARRGLESKALRSQDIDRYLGIIEERVRSRRTGAQWMLGSLQRMAGAGTPEERLRALVLRSLEHQRSGEPVHTWDLADLPKLEDWRHSYRRVEQFMSRDLFSVRPEDIVDFAAAVMEWEHIRHVPVEDDDGRLVGLVTHRDLLRMVARRDAEDAQVPIAQIMQRDVLTIPPDALTLEAIRLMRERGVGCLPVVREDGHLEGMVTEQDLLRIAGLLMERELAG